MTNIVTEVSAPAPTRTKTKLRIKRAPQINPTQSRWPAAVALNSWVQLTTTSGVYRGRVRLLSAACVSIQDGAGMWRIDRASVLAAQRTRPEPWVLAERSADECEAQARRILSRWA